MTPRQEGHYYNTKYLAWAIIVKSQNWQRSIRIGRTNSFRMIRIMKIQENKIISSAKKF